MNLFRRKSVTQLQAEALTDQRLKRALGATNLTMLGHWRDHWHRHFCADGHSRGAERGTCSDSIIRSGGRSLNFRGALL